MLIQKDSSTKEERKYFTLPTASHSQTFPVTIVFPPSKAHTPHSHFWLLLRIIKVVIILLNIIHSLKKLFGGVHSEEREREKTRVENEVVLFSHSLSNYSFSKAISRSFVLRMRMESFAGRILMSFKFSLIAKWDARVLYCWQRIRNLFFIIEIPANLALKRFSLNSFPIMSYTTGVLG